MKKLIIIMLGAFFAVSCSKTPDTSELDDNYAVITNYKKDVDFKSYTTFYISDTIRKVSDISTDSLWIGSQDANAKSIIDKISNDLKDRGYTQVTDPALKSTVSLGLQVTAVRDLRVIVTTNPWWWYYPDWYWGWFPYYPLPYPYPYYPVDTYSYITASILIDMIDIQNTNNKGQSAVVWNSFANGLLSGSNSYDMSLTLQSIDQAFAQSPYLSK